MTICVDDLRPYVNEFVANVGLPEWWRNNRYWYPLAVPTYGTREILESLDSMMTFNVSCGNKVRQFEDKFAERQGCESAVMVNSGSSADLLISLMLLNPARPRLRRGDEVLIPAVTWPTQIWSLMIAGFDVRLVDVDPHTLNVDVEALEAAISSRTRAVFVVHLMGNPCDMDRVLNLCQKHDLELIEDCCEALSAKWNGKAVGNFGLGGAFSFYFSHQITTMEGGMIVTNDRADADHLRALRSHGWSRGTKSEIDFTAYPDIDPRYAFINWGLNVRPMEVQGSFGLHQITNAELFYRRREAHYTSFANFLRGAIEYLTLPKVENGAQPDWFCIPLMVSRDSPFSRKDLSIYLEKQGVETRPMVVGNISRHPVSSLFPGLRVRLPGADAIHERGLYIGLPPVIDDCIAERLIETFDMFLGQFR